MEDKHHKQEMKMPEPDLLVDSTDYDPAGNRFYHPIVLKRAVAGGILGGIFIGLLAWLLAEGIIAVEGLGQIAAGGSGAATFFGFTTGSAIGALAGSFSGLYSMLQMQNRSHKE